MDLSPNHFYSQSSCSISPSKQLSEENVTKLKVISQLTDYFLNLICQNHDWNTDACCNIDELGNMLNEKSQTQKAIDKTPLELGLHL